MSANSTYASFFSDVIGTCFSITCKHNSFNVLTIKISNSLCRIRTSFIGDDDAAKVYITFCYKNLCTVFSRFCWIPLNIITFHKTTVTNKYLLTICHTYHTFACQFLNEVGRLYSNALSLCFRYDACCDWMGRYSFDSCCHGQQLSIAHMGAYSFYVLYFKFTRCDSTSFIKSYCFHTSQRLDNATTFKQDAVFRSITDTGEECEWYAKYQCAWTRNNEEC